MSTESDLKREIERLEHVIAPLAQQLESTRRTLRKVEAAEFVMVNRITKDDVELSDGKGKPFFHHISNFIDWMRTHSTKNWAEWNTRIYRMSDLMAGRMPETPACIDDVPTKGTP